MQKAMLEQLGYQVNDRRYSDISDIIKGSEDYSRFRFKAESNNDVVYTGAEHTPDDPKTKLPNLTQVPNLETIDGVAVMGCTMGHHQDMPGEKRMQELYEFDGYGAMVLDHDGQDTVDLLIAQPGDKILVPNHCHMTIYNLDRVPLNTADFASPYKEGGNFNAANKDMQKGSTGGIGPIFCAYLENRKVIFKLNRAYINSSNRLAKQYGSGVKLIGFKGSDLTVNFEIDYWKTMYEEILQNADRFRRMGVQVKTASRMVKINGTTTKESLHFMLLRDDLLLQRYFGMI